MGLIGLKSRLPGVLFLETSGLGSGEVRERSVFSFFQLPEVAGNPWIVGFFHLKNQKW